MVVPATDPNPNLGCTAPDSLCGKVLMWDNRLSTYSGTERLFNPYTGAFQMVPLSLSRNCSGYQTGDANGFLSIYCAGHSFLSDGKVLVTGGRIFTNPDDGLVHGPLESFWFNPLAAGTLLDPYWTPVGCSNRMLGTPTRNGGRYYSTNISLSLLPDYPDAVLTFSGTDITGNKCSASVNNTVERFNRTLTSGTWTALSWQAPIDIPPNTCPTPLSTQPQPGLYPRLHLLPTGNPSVTGGTTILYSGGAQDQGWRATDPTTQNRSWKYQPNSATPPLDWKYPISRYYNHERKEGTSVLLPIVLNSAGTPSNPVRVLTLGGIGPNITNTAEIFTDSPTTGTWAQAAYMANSRMHVNAVLLPDGNIFVVGGEAVACVDPSFGETTCISQANCGDPVKQPEIYNPVTGTWNWQWTPPVTLPDMARPRQYHSTAVLLQDGSVLVAGGETDRYCSCAALPTTPPRGAPCPTAEIYQPGYFYRGARPTILPFTSGSTMRYGQQFSINTPQAGPLPTAGTVQKVVMIRPSAVTHSFNQEQRYIELAIDPTSIVPGMSLKVNAPAHANVAPQGYYMLFVVTYDTSTPPLPIPSEGAFIRLIP